MLQNKYVRFSIFLITNFSALYAGTLLMDNGPRTAWYLSLNKAPWTPPGWVFGMAWSLIMLLFSFYMTKLSYIYKYLDQKLIIIYSLQWFLNVVWNLVFFNQHFIVLGLVTIVTLWLLIFYVVFKHIKSMKYYTVFIVPYLIWMTIATSLNAYIVF